ncbi:MAG: bifunctional metallophosphatase/5'-nucleotidase [Armatimonadetes bacterium]|nr:bifunctional metallophosphatase/5'-nucleotidase [Armatimonadota bacterium]
MIRILHTNDFHGKLTAERKARLQELRATCDLYVDTGDAIRAGNLAIPLGRDPVWGHFADLNLTASVPGNRESHVLSSIVAKKLDGASHPILCANWWDTQGKLVFKSHLVVSAGEVKVGLVAAMVPMVTEKMKTRPLSQYLWTEPIQSIQEVFQNHKRDADVWIALTHIGTRKDQLLAEKVQGLSAIIGGHSHDKLLWDSNQVGVPIVQAGSHGRFAGILTLTDQGNFHAHEIIDLPSGR